METQSENPSTVTTHASDSSADNHNNETMIADNAAQYDAFRTQRATPVIQGTQLAWSLAGSLAQYVSHCWNPS